VVDVYGGAGVGGVGEALGRGDQVHGSAVSGHRALRVRRRTRRHQPRDRRPRVPPPTRTPRPVPPGQLRTPRPARPGQSRLDNYGPLGRTPRPVPPGQLRTPRPVHPPRQDPRPVDRQAALPRHLALARPPRRDLPRRRHRHPQSHRHQRQQHPSEPPTPARPHHRPLPLRHRPRGRLPPPQRLSAGGRGTAALRRCPRPDRASGSGRRRP
jgi:hypothetical protein